MSLKHSWKWLAPRSISRHVRGECCDAKGGSSPTPTSRPCLATMESLGDRILLSGVTESSIIIEPPTGGANAQILLGLLKGSLAITEDQVALMKAVGASSPLPIPYPNHASKAPVHDAPIVQAVNKASNIMLQLDEAIFDFGESLIKGELSAQKVATSKHKLDYLKIELKDILVSSLSVEDQQKIDPILDSLDGEIAGLIDGLLKYQDSGSASVDQAIWLKLTEDIHRADELLFKGGLDFVKANSPGLILDDFQNKIDDVLNNNVATILKLSDPIAQKVMLLGVQDFAIGAESLLGSLSGGGDFDGGIVLLESSDDVIT